VQADWMNAGEGSLVWPSRVESRPAVCRPHESGNIELRQNSIWRDHIPRIDERPGAGLARRVHKKRSKE